MVSHHVGIRNLLKSGIYKKNRKEVITSLKNILEEKPQVFLGEIFFDNFALSQKELLEKYEKDYSKIANLLNKSFDNQGVNVLDHSLRYSFFNIIDFNLDKRVCEYYKIGTHN